MEGQVEKVELKHITRVTAVRMILHRTIARSLFLDHVPPSNATDCTEIFFGQPTADLNITIMHITSLWHLVALRLFFTAVTLHNLWKKYKNSLIYHIWAHSQEQITPFRYMAQWYNNETINTR